MDSLTQTLLRNALAWEIEGTYWRDEDLEDCVHASHIKPYQASKANTRARKIVEAYAAMNDSEERPTNNQKRAFKDSERIWGRRFDGELEDFLGSCLDEIEEKGVRDQAQYILSPK